MSNLVGNPEDRFSRVAAHLLSLCFQSYESRLSAGKILIEVEENEVSAKELRTVVIFFFPKFNF